MLAFLKKKFIAVLTISYLLPLDSYGEGDYTLSLNRWARYVAGIDAYDETDVSPTALWVNHQRELQTAWKTCKKERLKRMKAWARNYISAPPLPVFYPFSGPDIQTPLAFFPDSRLFIMVGLEPVGDFLSKARLDDWIELSRRNNFYNNTLKGLLKRSFFITEEMKKDLKTGLMPILLAMLARHGYHIMNADYVRINENGVFEHSGNKNENAIKIVFTKNQTKPKTLIYMQANLVNGHIPKGLERYLDKQDMVISLVKACSYALHYPSFREIKNKILNKSFLIVQDDTGIPYKDVNQEKWSVELYGNYQNPVKIFSQMFQPDLKKAYETTEEKSLGFPIGYGYKVLPSNLMILERK